VRKPSFRLTTLAILSLFLNAHRFCDYQNKNVRQNTFIANRTFYITMNRIVIRFNAIFPLSLFFFLLLLLDKVTIAIKLQSELKSSIVNDLVIVIFSR